MRRMMRRSTVPVLYLVKSRPYSRCSRLKIGRYCASSRAGSGFVRALGRSCTGFATCSRMAAGICSGFSMKWQTPVPTALLGIASNWADCGFCATTSPPEPAMARIPSVPSMPVPDRITPTDRSPTSLASDLKKKSIGSSTR